MIWTGASSAAQHDEDPDLKASNQSQNADDLEFNTDFLDPNLFRGLDKSKLNKVLGTPEGSFNVEVRLNSSKIDDMQILFKRRADEGEIRACLSAANIKMLKIKSKSLTAKAADFLAHAADVGGQGKALAGPCLLIDEVVEGSTEKYDSGELRLDLTVPQAALAKAGSATGPLDLTFGENAIFANYLASGFQLFSPNQNQSSQFLSLNGGINLVPWQIRRTINVSRSGDSDLVVNYGDYLVKRTFVDWKTTLTLGNLNSQSQNLGGVTAHGLRLSSEEQLMPLEERVYNPAVRGVARTNARVQLKQNGVVFSEQNVPPGPFEFDDLRPPSSVGDIEVTVTDASGGQDKFYLPYSNVGRKLNPGSFRYSLMLGQYPGAQGTNIFLAQGSLRYGWNDAFTPEIDFFISPNHLAAASGFVLDNFLGTQFGTFAVSKTMYPVNVSGYNGRFGLSYNIGQSLRLNYQRSQQSESYLDPSSALSYQIAQGYKSLGAIASNALMVSTNIPLIGTFSLSYSAQDIGAQTNVNQNISLGYSRGFPWFSIYGSVNQSVNNFGVSAGSPVLSANMGLTIPLQKGGRLAASASAREGSTNAQNIGYNGRWGENANYGLSYGSQGSASSASMGADFSHALGISNFGLSQSSSGTTQLNVGNSGAIVLHRKGVLMGPSVGETFGIVEVEGGENVQVQGQQGQLNRDGFGLVSWLSPYAENQVLLNLEKSNLDLELESSVASVAPVNGSVVRLAYKSRVGRPLLLTFTREENTSIPMGADLINDEGEVIGVSGRNHWAIARVRLPNGFLTAKWGDKPAQSCKAKYTLNLDRPEIGSNGEMPILLSCKSQLPIPIGSEIFDSSGAEIAITGQGGRALVRVKEDVGVLKVQWGVRPSEFCQSPYAIESNTKVNSNGFIPMQLQCM